MHVLYILQIVQGFMIVKLNCNSLKNIHSWMLVLYGQCTGSFTEELCGFQLIHIPYSGLISRGEIFMD